MNVDTLLIKIGKPSSTVTISAVFFGAFIILWQLIAQIEQLSLINSSAYNASDYRYYIDIDNRLTLAEVEQIFTENDTTESTRLNDLTELNLTREKQTYWIKFNLASHSQFDTQLVLHADNSPSSFFHLYRLDPVQDKFYLISKQSTELENKQHSPRDAHINFSLGKQQLSTFLIQIKSEGAANTPLTLYTKENFNTRKDFGLIIFGLFIGAFLSLAFYHLILLFSLKDKLYLVYSVYSLLALTIFIVERGFGTLFISREIDRYLTQYLFFCYYFLIGFMVIFSVIFLGYQKSKNLIYIGSLGFCTALFACAIFSLSQSPTVQTELLQVSQNISYLLILVIILTRFRRNSLWARFYLISWLPLLASAVINYLVASDAIKASFFTLYAFPFAVLVQLLFIALALSERSHLDVESRREIAYDINTDLPRQSNLENTINRLISLGWSQFCVVVIKPENIEKVSAYIESKNYDQLFQRISDKLNTIFADNIAIQSLTQQQEKLCYINNNSLALLINDKRSLQEIKTIIDAIQQGVKESFHIDDFNLSLSSVIGLADYSKHLVNPHFQLINNAVKAAIDAENLPCRYGYFIDKPKENIANALEIAKELKHAFERDQLELYHQPQIDLKTLRVCSSECLLRWFHNTLGEISPKVFIPIAEEFGMMNQLTLWVVERALQQHLQIIGDKQYNHMVSINISRKDITSKNFYQEMINIIEMSGVPPEKIIFELDKPKGILKIPQSIELIKHLNEFGITFSINDSGKNQALTQISDLPFQEVKINKKLIKNLNDSPQHKNIIVAAVKKAKNLHLEVVAEGINSQEDEDLLRKIGCDIGQGFFYAQALPIQQYLEWLDQQENGQTQKRRDLEGEFIPANKKINLNI